MNTDTLSATEIELWLKLMSTEGVGDVTAQVLLKTFGLPEQIFAQSHTSLTRVVSDRVARALLGAADDDFKDQVLVEKAREERYALFPKSEGGSRREGAPRRDDGDRPRRDFGGDRGGEHRPARRFERDRKN